MHKLINEDYQSLVGTPLEKYLDRWFNSCLESAKLLLTRGEYPQALLYIKRANDYLGDIKIIGERELKALKAKRKNANAKNL